MLSRLLAMVILIALVVPTAAYASVEGISVSDMISDVTERNAYYSAFATAESDNRTVFVGYAVNPSNISKLNNRFIGYSFRDTDIIEVCAWSYESEDLFFAAVFGAVLDNATSAGRLSDIDPADLDILGTLTLMPSPEWSKQYRVGQYYLEALSSASAANSIWLFVNDASLTSSKLSALSQISTDNYPDSDAVENLKTLVREKVGLQ